VLIICTTYKINIMHGIPCLHDEASSTSWLVLIEHSTSYECLQ